ncbi:hypothetical protein [Ancylobacter radicis]|uniref:DUF680 domain-containing protein n=1 Tax=Ancylobacter radicis TaxID=2836179 RepID=A0ABS5RDQ3_9HYPH|nr:hypothetical protein [Ancylobacter radicis]MBS9478482.1 hypothetical protein [Ancylobacter radicis]
MNAFNWKMTVTATILSLVAAGVANTALAEGARSAEKTGYEAAARGASEPKAAGQPGAPLVEGRNASVNVPPAPPLETYIRRSIEMDKRSNR